MQSHQLSSKSKNNYSSSYNFSGNNSDSVDRPESTHAYTRSRAVSNQFSKESSKTAENTGSNAVNVAQWGTDGDSVRLWSSVLDAAPYPQMVSLHPVYYQERARTSWGRNHKLGKVRAIPKNINDTSLGSSSDANTVDRSSKGKGKGKGNGEPFERPNEQVPDIC